VIDPKGCRLALCAILALAATSAAAGPYTVQQTAIQLALPNSGPRGAHDYHNGDRVLDVPLLWAAAATLRAPATVLADGASEQLPAGKVLPMQMLVEGNGVAIPAFCTPRRAGERFAERRASGVLGLAVVRSLIRGWTDRQTCLIDSDQDGRADLSLIVGDGSAEARTPRAIEPVPIEVAELVPISDQDRVTIVLSGTGRDWAEFTLNIVQQGHARNFDSISGHWGSSMRTTRVRLSPGRSQAVSIMGAAFWLTGVDKPSRAARILWETNVDTRLYAVVPDGLRVVSR
jgi:hypothetical protein